MSLLLAFVLDVSALRNALAALMRSHGYLHSALAKDPGLYEQFRAACIQSFEFTYDLAYKMLKRQLEVLSPNPGEVDQMTFMQVIRTGAEAGLLSEVARFRNYREKRNITSHTYDAEKAEQVVSILTDFIADISHLLSELEKRNARSS